MARAAAVKRARQRASSAASTLPVTRIGVCSVKTSAA